MISYFKKHPYAVLLIVIMIIGASITTYQAYNSEERISKEGLYTTATITGTKGSSSGRWIIIEYEYEGKGYSATLRNYSIPKSWIGEKVLVRFLPSDPIQVVLIENFEVNDSIKAIKAPVWKNIP